MFSGREVFYLAPFKKINSLPILLAGINPGYPQLRAILQDFSKLQMPLSVDSAILSLHFILQVELLGCCMRLLTAALLMAAKERKPPQHAF